MKRIFFFTALFYTLFLTFISYRVSKAYFADMTVSNTNTFTAAAVFPSSSPSATPTITITPSISPIIEPENIADHLVISEVQILGATSENDFIELYNPTNSPINLGGYRLVKRTSSGSVDLPIKSFTNSDIVPAYSYYLWANSNNDFALSLNADASTAATLTSSNSIALRNGPENTGTIIDAMGWGTLTGTPLLEIAVFSQNPSANQSIERKAISSSNASTMISGGQDEQKGNSYDSNNNDTDFILRIVSQPQNSGSPAEIL